VHSSADLQTVDHPSIPKTIVVEGSVTIRPADCAPDAAPVKIGFLSDLPSGAGVARSLDPILLAFEDAMIEGRLTHPIELFAMHALGLPYGSADYVVAAFRELVDRGCSIVLSTGVTNNAVVLRDVINEVHVPYITMAGTTTFVGDYCFLLPNGGHSEEATIVAAYLADRGLRRVVLTGEGTDGDVEYRKFFEEQASLYGLEIIETYYFPNDPTDAEVDAELERFRSLEPDALAYVGFGINTKQFGQSLKRIGWDPPRAMNTAILWAFAGGEWAEALEGWVGIDQTNNDHDDVEPNRNYKAMIDRFEKRFGNRRDSTMTALFYDQGRSAAEAIINGPSQDGPGLKAGLERIAMMPSTLGGPRTYIGFGPNDHRGYRGDFMFMKELRADGKFHFVQYHWPQWQANRTD
jgi:ABC-type branched-subunit amino acid transport system substrate-binding protein